MRPPWLCQPEPVVATQAQVFGAGIAGACVARALAEVGIRVTLVDSCAATKASGNLAGLVRPLVCAPSDPRRALYDAAFTCFLQWWARYASPHSLASLGVLDLRAYHFDDALRQNLDAKRAAHYSGLDIAGAVYAAQALAIRPRAWIRQLIDHPSITLVDTAPAAEHSGLRIWATGAALARAHPALGLAWQFAQSSLVARLLPAPNIALAGRGYLCPVGDGRWIVGAQHGHSDFPAQAANCANLQRLAKLLGEPYRGELVGEFRAARAAGYDHLPVVGGLPDWSQAATDYADLAKGRAVDQYPALHYVPNTYVIGGLGSHGLMLAPLLAQTLVDLLRTGAAAWATPLHPFRFAARRLAQGRDARFSV